MSKQKFNYGDHVMIAGDLEETMRHFKSGCEAIVEYSYAERYGGNDMKSYSLHIKGGGSCSWYKEDQLTLIEAGRPDLLDKWEKEIQDEIKEKSDLDWIFSNGKEVINNPHGSSIQALACCFGLDNLWGSRGEGFDYYNNSMQTLSLAHPFLECGDKDGWLDICKSIKMKTQIRDGVINEPRKIYVEQ